MRLSLALCRRELTWSVRRALKASLSGKGLSEADQERLGKIQQENAKYQTDLRDLTEKLRSAKKVRFSWLFSLSRLLTRQRRAAPQRSRSHVQGAVRLAARACAFGSSCFPSLCADRLSAGQL